MNKVKKEVANTSEIVRPQIVVTKTVPFMSAEKANEKMDSLAREQGHTIRVPTIPTKCIYDSEKGAFIYSRLYFSDLGLTAVALTVMAGSDN